MERGKMCDLNMSGRVNFSVSTSLLIDTKMGGVTRRRMYEPSSEEFSWQSPRLFAKSAYTTLDGVCNSLSQSLAPVRLRNNNLRFEQVRITVRST